MELKDKVKRLKDMLSQMKPLEAYLPPDETQESAKPAGARFAPQEIAKAASGLLKLQEGREREIDPEEARGLEAIILPNERPVYFVKGGDYPVLGFPWTTLNDAGTRQRLQRAISGIGRIELPTNPRYPYGGTGFLVGDGLLMTNRHVAEMFVEGLGATRLKFNRGDAAVDFVREKDSPEDDRSAWFEVLDVLMVHPFWDMALVRIDGLPSSYVPLTLSINEPAEGADVVAIGYPARDDRSNLAEQDRIFEVYNIKRFQPGKARRRERIRSFENVVNALTHDVSTLGGNSGSAVVDPATGHVVGLHFAGIYLKANYMVPALELARDSRVVDTGVNFAGSVPSTDEWEDAWKRTSSAEQFVGSPPQIPSSVQAPAASSRDAGSMTWTIPLKVTVSIGTPSAAPDVKAVTAPTVAAVEAMRVPIIYDGLETREGFDPTFLQIEGTSVTGPELTDSGKRVAAPVEDGTNVLKYHRFSIVMHKVRRLAIFTAANVDWRPEVRKIDGKKPTRKELTGLGKNDQEKWVTDWRIANDHQLPDAFYTNDRQAFDKGHLVRRDDVAWGSSFEDMQIANGDTYHTTNCSPQTKQYNQGPQGEDNWGDLEDLVEKQTKAERAIVFSGPVLARDDRYFEGVDEDKGSLKVRIPRRFWKIVVVKGDRGPEAFGFVLEQDLANVRFREEFMVPSEWVAHMKRISDIEDLLYGLASLESLKAWDQYDAAGGESIRGHL